MIIKKTRIDTVYGLVGLMDKAYESGWRDLGWMEEDGDLDPIRETPRYQALRARMQAELDALLADPEDDDPAAPSER